MKKDVIIIGAGAAGLMCAIEAGKRGRSVLVIDHANKVGKKILMSGGGRCNFTNENIEPEKFLSHNPHFCKSALSRYTQWDFIELVKKHRIPFHHKTLGQLFCDKSAKDIVAMLLKECDDAGVEIQLKTPIKSVEQLDTQQFRVKTPTYSVECTSLVVATGGLSIPTMGATPFGYHIAEQFGLKVWPTRAGLVPITLHTEDKARFECLSGISSFCRAEFNDTHFDENMLFTHRGLSGPAILQISSYWEPGHPLVIRLLPELDLFETLKQAKKNHSRRTLNPVLSEHFPRRVIDAFIKDHDLTNTMGQFSDKALKTLADTFQNWTLKPNGTEGYRTAEVTLGGLDTNTLSSKTMETKTIPGLYFIGEVVDVTGWLGGYNFQWAWSSGWAAGQAV